jgi:tetratricopeptide (TPR) repeat protein
MTHDDEQKRLDESLKKMSEEQFQISMRQAAYLLSHGNPQDAITLLERCYQLHPEDVNLLLNLGGAYILAERHRYAVPVLEKASELDSANPAVWSNLAAAYLGKLVTATEQRQVRALAAYARVIELEPDYPNVHYNMGLIFIDRREWDKAHAAFTHALRTNPDDKDAYNMRQRIEEIRSQPPNN